VKLLVVSEGKNELEGALAALVQRCLGRQDIEFEQMNIRDDSVRHIRGVGDRLTKKALAWVLAAQNRGFDAIVIVIDRDGDIQRPRQFDAAQDDVRVTTLPRALGVAVESFDAWALADEQALSVVLEAAIARQQNPEQQKDPKESCDRLLRDSNVSMSRSELYARVAQYVDLRTLQDRCPKGFAVFAKRVENLGEVAI
jgi:hypothetical protein